MEVKVLHVLRTYLPETENWLYHLLNNTVDVMHTIYCEKFLPGIFENKKFRYLPLPSSYEPDFNNSIFGKINRYIHVLGLQISGRTKHRFFTNLTESQNPDIIHFHFGTMALAYETVLMKTKTPFIVSFYGYDYNPTYNYKKIFNKATAIVCEGKAGKQQLIDLGCPEEKIVMIPLGIIPLENLPMKHKTQGKLKLVQIASFTEKKGQIYAVQAVEQVLASCPDITLTLIGPESPTKNHIADYIHQNKLEKAIKIKNAISPDQLSNELIQYDVFIHPSLTAENGDNEGGAPVVLLNAQNCGLPVISTFHKDIPAFVKHETSGFLAQEKNIHELVKYIHEFCQMPEYKFREYSTNAKEHVTLQFNVLHSANLLCNLYSKIKNEAGKSGII